MTEHTLKKGDHVAVVTRGFNRSIRECAVTRVLKRFIELDDGSKWRGALIHYRPWPEVKGGFGFAHLEPWDDEQHLQPMLAIGDYWEDATVDELRAVLAIMASIDQRVKDGEA